ncbi:hypothetical protein MCEMSEM23_03240 [Rhabdaerophilaceae bacterium]
MNLDVNSGLLIIGGIAMIWFATRHLYGPKRPRVSMLGMFRREAVGVVPGLGIAALRSMIDDLVTLVKNTQSLRGLVIAGPFAARLADPTSTVTAILFSTDLTGQGEPLALAGWPYPARGHDIRSRKVEEGDGFILHHLTLRGAPPLTIAFVRTDLDAAPEPLRAALDLGAISCEIGTRDAEVILARWSIKTIKHKGS